MISVRSKTFPLPSSQSIEVDFIENRESELHKVGIERKCTFNSEKARFVPQTTVEEITYDALNEPINPLELQLTRNQLESAISTLKERKGKKNEVIAKFNISDAHSWADVVIILTEVELAYSEKESVGGKVRAAFRRIEEHAKSIKPFVQMLPDGDYKTLCGGLTLILSAMMKKREIREKMADILNQLPMVVQECEDYAQLYNGNNSLRRCIELLYIELVGAITDMVHWYSQRSFKRSAGALLQNDDYANSIDRRIIAINQAKTAFEKETDKYLHYRADAIHNTVQETHDNVFVIGNLVCENKSQLHNMEEAIRESTRAVNGLYDLLQDHTLKAQRNQEKEGLQKEARDQRAKIQELQSELREKSLQLQEKTIRAKRLIQRLGLTLPVDAHPSDIEASISNGLTSGVRFQTRTKQIISTDQYVKWHESAASSMLCVNGNWEQDALSPTSFLSALLTTNLQQQNSLVLHFSCGLHTSSIEVGEMDVGGPLLLLRTLLAQILSIEDLDTQQHLSIINESEIESLEDGSFQQHLESFLNLAENIGRTSDGIVIIIDSVEYYEYTWRKKTKKLIKGLRRLTDRTSSSQCPIKVLIMASSRCLLFRDSCHLSLIDMPDELEAESSELDSF